MLYFMEPFYPKRRLIHIRCPIAGSEHSSKRLVLEGLISVQPTASKLGLPLWHAADRDARGFASYLTPDHGTARELVSHCQELVAGSCKVSLAPGLQFEL